MQKIIFIQYFKTPFGELILGSYQGKLCLADWRYHKMRDAIDLRIQKKLNVHYVENSSDIIEKTKIQLNEYFNNNRKQFDIPLLFIGTPFQQQVWLALQQIPYGKTKSYLDLSKLLKREKAVRAVASANGANAISIIIPCHRIIGSNGNLVGYAGGISTKKKLLELEGAINNTQLTLF